MVPVKSFMVPREKFITVERDTDAQTAARIMRDRGIGSLFVTNGKEIVGILTDTDMVRRVVAAGGATWRLVSLRVPPQASSACARLQSRRRRSSPSTCG